MAGSRFRVVVVLALLVAVSPASGVASGGTTVPGLHLKISLPAMTGNSKTQTCQAGTRQRKRIRSRSVLVGDAHKVAVVACEQPPKADLLTPQTLAHSVSGAFATEG